MPVIANVHDSHHLVHLLHAAALIGAVLERRQVGMLAAVLQHKPADLPAAASPPPTWTRRWTMTACVPSARLWGRAG